MVLRRLNLAPDNPVLLAMKGRLDRVLDLIEKRLGEADSLPAAIHRSRHHMVFSLTTMRVFLPIDLAPIRICFDISGASALARRISVRCARVTGHEPLLT